ncbi:DUF4328 domain-containing protein [Streptomyces zagrosensis]|uniref:ABC-type thiamine/hydroxymethylpyrimidine transport system permease subunit n=1 Tax=Streptomyces zagrosensis TaxID=1042984 RepID=A0A7W9Q725_9ACTN|nr:DUF4328 domain-containing protein [Streptomyces zagrosensis]MBB5934811.1 ABC-type thiamine/hydroxymethylpyrimidine transport system permease subunit [Streptomyces zagrosensis]
MTAPADLRRGLSTALMVLFGVAIAALVLALIARGGQYSQLGDQLDGKHVTRDEIEDADAFYLGMFVLSSLVMVAIAVVWAIWFRRLRLNAETFAPGQHRFTSGWAAGAWFTPVVNLWFPKQIANDIWRASSPQGPHSVPRGLLNAWWVTWISGGVIFGLAATRYSNAKNEAEESFHFITRNAAEDAHSALALHMFGYVVTIASAILAILVVRQITGMQQQRALLPPQSGAGSDPFGGMGGAQPYGVQGAQPYGVQGGQPYGTTQPYGGAAPYGGQQYGGQQFGGDPGTPPGSGQQQAPGQQNPYGSGPAGY